MYEICTCILNDFYSGHILRLRTCVNIYALKVMLLTKP
jgi:hypothetical protein